MPGPNPPADQGQAQPVFLVSPDGEPVYKNTDPVPGDYGALVRVVSQPPGGSGLTDTELRAAPVPMSLATAPTTPVTGIFWQATQPVSGPATDAQMRATPLPVSGTVTASGPVTDAQLRATPVPVSGTVTASGPLTDAQLRASAVPVSAAALPLPAGASTETTLAAASAKLPATLGQKAMAASLPVTLASDQTPTFSDLAVTATGAAAAAVTATLPAVASQKHYISLIEITLYNSSARTGGATPVVVTSTNLPAGAWTFPSAGAIGTTTQLLIPLPVPLRSVTANTATTIVCPATTGIIWRVNVQYRATA